MKKSLSIPVLTVSACLLGCLWGCLLREETLRVGRDGSVQYEVAIEGDSEAEVRKAEGPDPAGGWTVEITSKTNEQGETTWSRAGRLEIPPGGKLPDRFVAEPPASGVFLRFPTQVTVEKRGDGRYYQFRRVYQPVPWRVYDWHRARILEEEQVAETLEMDKEKWTEGHYRMVCEALMQVRIQQQAFLLSQALSEAAADLPQDVGLRIRESLLALGENFNWEPYEEALKLPKEERDKRLESLGEAFEATLKRTLELACKAHVSPERLEAVQAALQQVEQRFKTIEGYGEQGFVITVYLPGKIIGHNGKEAEDGKVTFELDGKTFRDRPHELLATSFVPAEKD